MAITISSHPAEVITNAPEFTVTTSLTEGASQQNLRIRATVYIGGVDEAVAVLEQPKGLDDWDFFKLLKSLTGKCNEAVGGSDIHVQPGISAELLSSWTAQLGDFTTFSSTGRKINSAISSGGFGPDYAKSNDLGSAALGEMFIVAVENDFVDSGTEKAQIALSSDSTGFGAIPRVNYAGMISGELNNNHIYFFLVTAATSTPTLWVGNDDPDTNFSGTFSVHKITDFKDNPGIYFQVKFSEVYENASDVTIVTGTKSADTLLFMPVSVRPGETFSQYLITGSGKKFLSRAEDGDTLYKHDIGMELRLMYVSVAAYMTARVAVDAGTNIEADISNLGWGILVMNSEGGFTYNPDSDDQSIIFQIDAVINGGSSIYTGAVATVLCEMNCYADIKALSFIGDLGEETVIFRGLYTENGGAEKSYWKNQNRIRKVLNAYKKKVEILRTLYETEGIRRLIHQLTYTEKDVWMFNSDFEDNYREVTVLTDSVVIEDKRTLLETDIEVEYYE